MRFGGHQTFAIREGWLYKGLKLVIKDPERLGADDLPDWLGVGKNMAKAIHHWLLATGLAERDLDAGPRSKILRPTEFGEEVWKRDQYFLLPGTWWAVHIQLTHLEDHAFTWHWFFNHFSSARFERPICAEALRRFLASTGQRMPASRTLERDVACLLKSYAVSVPREEGDPEDALECPLSELGLLMHSRQTGFYHLDRELKPIPFHLFGYALALKEERFGPGRQQQEIDFSLSDLAHGMYAPGRVFSLTEEATYELVATYEAQRLLRLDGQLGERVVRLPGYGSREWLGRYYDSVERSEEAAA